MTDARFGKPETINHAHPEIKEESLDGTLSNVDCGIQIRMVSGLWGVIGIEETWVAEARYVPNRQLLSIPFRSELIHCTA